MTLNYNTYTYTPTRDELKKFFKHELSKQEIAQEYIDNYYADETPDGLAELADMYPEGTTVKNIENDADGWIYLLPLLQTSNQWRTGHRQVL